MKLEIKHNKDNHFFYMEEENISSTISIEVDSSNNLEVLIKCKNSGFILSKIKKKIEKLDCQEIENIVVKQIKPAVSEELKFCNIQPMLQFFVVVGFYMKW